VIRMCEELMWIMADALDAAAQRETVLFNQATRMKTETRAAEFARLQNGYKEAMGIAQEKMQIIERLQAAVDKRLKYMDRDLRKFAADLDDHQRRGFSDGILARVEETEQDTAERMEAVANAARFPWAALAAQEDDDSDGSSDEGSGSDGGESTDSRQMARSASVADDDDGLGAAGEDDDDDDDADAFDSLSSSGHRRRGHGSGSHESASGGRGRSRGATVRKRKSTGPEDGVVDASWTGQTRPVGRPRSSRGHAPLAVPASTRHHAGAGSAGAAGPGSPTHGLSGAGLNGGSGAMVGAAGGAGSPMLGVHMHGDDMLAGGRRSGQPLGAHVGMPMPIDPNEPRYCICHDVSYGEMVGCDNPNCKTEWFHYGCVGITEPPRGKWFCPDCRKRP
jgi:inhibitor of growth protein 3